MTKKSAGLLFFRVRKDFLEVLLVHPGGPFWKKKDAGVWTIPKGEIETGEMPLGAAIREVNEETGIKAEGNFIELTPVKQKSGKEVYAWAVEGDIDPADIRSNSFEMEWPPRSGIKKSFPEIDKAAWFTLQDAEIKIIEGQLPLMKELETLLRSGSMSGPGGQ
jgi:predicted NUDIX family NTP pyrophosphohydrolase